MALYKGKSGDWEFVGGLEIHAQIASKAKLFSAAPTDFGGEPNQNVSLIDAAFPGVLPTVNEECVRQAVRTGLALGAVVNQHSEFARKNYFYPDLPQGYQISQYDKPIIGEGTLQIDINGETKSVGIERLHLEQDAGKSIHDKKFAYSYIDLNRSGVALMEIVTKPDIRSPEEAVACVEKIRSILRYLGACDGNMAEGSLRADMNVSLRRPGEDLGTRAEIKNINSLKFLKQAIEYEVKRQMALLEGGEAVVQETRLFDADKGETRSMRSKEDAHDYRYFPDPDLLPLCLSDEYVEAQRATLPELPDVKKRRFIEDYGLAADVAALLVDERITADYFEVAAAKADAVAVANWVVSELFGRLNKVGRSMEDCPIVAEDLAALVNFINDGEISGKMAKEVFDVMFESGVSPRSVIEERGLRQVSDEGELGGLIDELLKDNEKQVEQYRGGKENVFGWFVGQVMKATKGSANPGAVNKLLRERLDKS